jgi:hypothetical protein
VLTRQGASALLIEIWRVAALRCTLALGHIAGVAGPLQVTPIERRTTVC